MNNNVIKVFVSQPMSDLTDIEIISNRNMAIKHLKDLLNTYEFTVVDNLQMDKDYDYPLEYLATDISMIKDADVVYFLKDWETHRGCIIEFQVAREYGIKMLFEEKY